MSLNFYFDNQMVGSECGANNMKPWFHHVLYQQFRLLVVLRDIFGLLLTNSAYLLVVSTHTHPFMTTVCDRLVAASSRTTCLRCQSSVISNWSLEHHNEFTVLKWPLQSPDSNPIDFLDVDECEMLIIDVADLQQLFAIKTATYFRVPLNIFLL